MPAFACEPVLPFVQAAVPMTLTRSLTVLAIAVVLKCALFVIFEKRIPRVHAAIFMFLGNIVSSIIGVLAAAMIGLPGTWMIAIPIVFLLSWIPGRRIAQVRTGWNSLAVAALLTVTLVVSVVFFVLGQWAMASENLAAYWIIKLIAIYLALIASIALSAAWEESMIWLLRARPAGTNYFRTVIRANIYVLLFIMLFAAILMLPKRLKSPDFLAKTRAQFSVIFAPAR